MRVLDEAEHADWRDWRRSREIGRHWVDSVRSLALKVPSFVAQPWGRNVLLNPRHPDFARVRVAEVAVAQLVTGQRGGGEQQREDRKEARHATSTQVFIPDAWCPSVWQWISHLPGLSKTQSTSRLLRESTSVVSR